MSDDHINVQKNNDESIDPGETSEAQADKSKEVVPEESIDMLRQQADQYKAAWQRANADYQNLCKEVETKRSELLVWSERQILEEFVPVFDNFKKAFKSKNGSWDKDQENWAKGIEYIMKQFESILKNHRVEEIKTVGESFNPEFHEAVGEVNKEGAQDGTIVEEIDAGYFMKGKILKAAKVIICKK